MNDEIERNGDDAMTTLEFKAMVKLLIHLLRTSSKDEAIKFLESLID